MNEHRLDIILEAQDRASRVLQRAEARIGRLEKAQAKQLKATQNAIKAQAGLNKQFTAGTRGLGNFLGAISPVQLGVAGLALVMADAVQEAAALDRGLAEVRTLLPDTSQSFGEMREEVLGFSNEIGKAATEVVPAMYQAISAGVPEKNVFSFIETANKAAVGGVTDLETSVDGLTTAVNAFVAQGLGVEQAADLMFAAVRTGKTTFEELSRSIGDIAPIAATLSVEFGELLAAISTITKGGVQTSVAATQVRSALQALVRPTEELSKVFTDAGFASGQAAVEQKGFAFAADLVAKAVKGDIGQLQALLGSIEAVNAVLGITGAQADTFRSDLEAMGNSAGAAEMAFQEMDNSESMKMEKALNRLNNFGAQLGSALLPVIAEFAQGSVDYLESIGDFWDQLPGELKRLLTGRGQVGQGGQVPYGDAPRLPFGGGAGGAISVFTTAQRDNWDEQILGWWKDFTTPPPLDFSDMYPDRTDWFEDHLAKWIVDPAIEGIEKIETKVRKIDATGNIDITITPVWPGGSPQATMTQIATALAAEGANLDMDPPLDPESPCLLYTSPSPRD